MHFWTQQEFEHALQFEKKPTYIIAFKLLFYTGMREGELLALTPEDLPKDDAIVDVNKNYAVVDGTEYFLTPKTKRSIRQITIPESLHTEVREYVDSLCLEPEERIFYFGKSGLYTELKRMTKRSGDRQIRVHDLRHSHVAMLVNMKISIEEISRRLGHDSVKTTWDTYSHLYLGTDRELANQIGDLISQDTAETTVDSAVKPEIKITPGCPLGKKSQELLSASAVHGNEHIRKNNSNIFRKYGINTGCDEICGYALETYLDLISFGDAIIQIISSFRPQDSLRDFILAMFSDAILSCESSNGNISALDKYLVNTTIPKYEKIYGIGVK